LLAEPQPEPVADAVPEPDPVADAVPEPDPVADAVPELVADAVPEPVADAVPEPEPEPVADSVLTSAPDPLGADVAPAPSAESEAPSAGARSSLRSGPILALLLTTVLMAVAAGFVWFQVQDHKATDQARQAGLEASRDAARVLFSYDYRTLPKDFRAGAAVTTGAFRKQYAETTSKVVTPVATEKKAVVKAEVVTAGVVRASTDKVVTIVYVNQVTTSSLQAGPKVDLSRVRMTLVHVGSGWLVSKVEAL
jgi:Mce-associated membrane protein